MSAYYASPGDPAAATVREELAPVLVAFAGPAPQSRLTVLIRLLMVIPHIVVLWALGHRRLRRGDHRLVRRPVHRPAAGLRG